MRKITCLFLITLCCLFVTCKEHGSSNDDDDEEYYNPNAGFSFSHNSGLYSQQFSLIIKAAEGSAIYYTTDGSVPVPNKTGTVKYSSPITIKNRNGEANVFATTQNSTNFYGLKDDPRGSMPDIYIPTKDQVPKATVIRAMAVDLSGKKSGVATKTYFIGNNLADYGNIRIVSLVSDPYNLVDVNYGIMVRGKSSNRWNPPADPYNFQRKGAEWEREAYLEIFEGNSRDKASLSTGVGIRVRGGWSRAAGQKSFSVYFKEQYGIKNLKNYNLIPKDNTLGTTGAVKADGKTPVATYKGFMLRNGANDSDYTKFYDVFLQDLLSDRSFSTQASVPCVLYLNGEYWGPYNFQERHSDNQTEYKYGVDKDNVISFDNGELDDGNTGEESYFWDMVNMSGKDMSVSSNYNNFCALVDIDNFIDYWAAEIYIYNEDWPQNNYRIWRTRNKEPGNKYGDQKWRYQMFDTEFAMGIYNGGGLTGQKGVNAFEKIINGDDKNHFNNKLFKSLLNNPDFCKKFVNTMMDLYNVNFHPDNYLPKLNSYEAVYRPLMKGYFSRWGGWEGMFNNKVNDAKNYLNDIRNAMVYNYLPKYFGTSGINDIGVTSGTLRDVAFAVAGANASIKINTITPNFASGSWTGKYYSSIPITVTASAPPSGYEFDGWTITNGAAASPAALTTTVNITGNTLITAKYKQKGIAVVPVTGINLNKSILSLPIGETSTLTATVSPPAATYNTVIWSSGKPSVASVNNGKITAVSAGTAIISASTTGGEYTATCTVTVIGPQITVLLDLAEVIKDFAAPEDINDGGAFSDLFDGLPVGPAGWLNPDQDVTFRIINEGGVIKLQINAFALWGPGLDIKAGVSGVNFQAGDRIEVKGRIQNIRTHNVVLNIIGDKLIKKDDKGENNYWEPLQGWNSGGEFQKTFTLSAYDASTINENQSVRIRPDGVAPYSGRDPEGIAIIYLEQVKVYRLD
jgi:hypothetical protein